MTNEELAARVADQRRETNAMVMPRPAPIRGERLSRIGKIEFATPIWEGDNGDVDFPLLLSQLGLVPVQVDTSDLVSRRVTAIYRWEGFPSVGNLPHEIPTYDVKIYQSTVTEDGQRRTCIDRLDFISVETVIALRSPDGWIINPRREDFDMMLLESGKENLAVGSTNNRAPTLRVPPRRIQVRQNDGN